MASPAPNSVVRYSVMFVLIVNLSKILCIKTLWLAWKITAVQILPERSRSQVRIKEAEIIVIVKRIRAYQIGAAL